MTQDKFFDSYIEDFYELGAENNNVFWFRGNKGDNDYVRTTRKIEFIGDDPVLIKNKLLQLKPNDNIFIHWYDMFIAEIVHDLPNKLFVSLMGGDFYAEPIEINLNYLYENRTLKLIYKYNKHLRPIYLRRNIYQIFKRYFVKKNEKNRLYQKKHKHLARIDYILALYEAKNEVELVKKRYPNFRAKHLSFNFNQNFDESVMIETDLIENKNERVKILIGNSLDPSNNHLDAFHILKSIKSKIEVYCTLSYGDIRYKDIIIKQGYELFGEHFHPITEFMNKLQYIEFINSIDIVYMNHIRSQAMGNIAIALTLGKPVFLNKKSPVFQLYKSIGIKCFDGEFIVKTNFNQIIEFNQKISASNRNKLKKMHTKQRRLDDLKNILENYAI